MDKPKIIFNDEPETINKLFKNDLKIEFNSLQEILVACIYMLMCTGELKFLNLQTQIDF